jgi:hypothetical protein
MRAWATPQGSWSNDSIALKARLKQDIGNAPYLIPRLAKCFLVNQREVVSTWSLRRKAYFGLRRQSEATTALFPPANLFAEKRRSGAPLPTALQKCRLHHATENGCVIPSSFVIHRPETCASNRRSSDPETRRNGVCGTAFLSATGRTRCGEACGQRASCPVITTILSSESNNLGQTQNPGGMVAFFGITTIPSRM